MRSPLSQKSQRAIRAYIVTHSLAPGDALPSEGEFVTLLEMGKTSVREGIRALESMGVVEVRHGRGLFVGSFSFDPLLEHLPYGLMVDNLPLRQLLQVRQALEEGLIVEVSQRITEEELNHLDTLVQRMYTETVDDVVPIEIDRAFHLALFAGLGNPLLNELITVFWTIFQNADSDLKPAPGLHTAEDHEEIVTAIRSGNPEAMRNAVVQHFADVRHALKKHDASRFAQTPTIKK
jgi:DNA-binding FadR family transcriptional regulator